MNERAIRARPSEDVVFTPLRNEEAVLLHLGTTRYYTLNRTGTSIWRLMSEGHSSAEIGQRLEQRFDIPDGQATRVVLDMLRSFASEQLVSLIDPPADGAEPHETVPEGSP